MIQILVIGHGSYATGVKENLAMVCGVPENMHFIDFSIGMERADLEHEIEKETENLGNAEILFCCDLPGATPFQICAIKTSEEPEKYVTVVGLNSMAFMEMSMGITEESILSEVAEQAVNTAKEAVMKFPE